MLPGAGAGAGDSLYPAASALSLWTITTLAVVAFGLVEALFMNSVFLKINDVSFIFWLALGALMLETEDKAPAAERTL